MKKLIHIGLLMLIVLSIFVFCETAESNDSTIAPKDASKGPASSIYNIDTLIVGFGSPGYQPCGPGSGGGQGPDTRGRIITYSSHPITSKKLITLREVPLLY